MIVCDIVEVWRGDQKNTRKTCPKIKPGPNNIGNVLGSDQDMADLYLTEASASTDDHDEVELLLESYASDLQTLALEVSKMRASLEDTDDFVNIHLSTKRNEIIRLSLFMDMATLSLASGILPVKRQLPIAMGNMQSIFFGRPLLIITTALPMLC